MKTMEKTMMRADESALSLARALTRVQAMMRRRERSRARARANQGSGFRSVGHMRSVGRSDIRRVDGSSSVGRSFGHSAS